jgi:hypothetical protein
VLSLPIERLLAMWRLPVSGRIDSGLHLTGPTQRPLIAGQVTFTDVRAAGTVLGDGTITLAPERGGTGFTGRVVPALAVEGRVGYRPAPAVAAVLTLDQLPLQPFLGAVPGMSGHLSGRADLRADARHYGLTADLDQVVLGYRLPRLAVELTNQAPAHLEGSERGLELAPVTLAGRGIQAVARGQFEPGRVSARVDAQVALAPFAEVLRPFSKETAGAVDVGVRIEGPLAGPAITGTLTVREPLRLWPPELLVPVQVPSGTVTVDYPRVTFQKLALSLASLGLQVDGELRLAPLVMDSALDVAITGAVEGALLASRLPTLLGNGHGRASVDGRLGGTLAAPTFDGHADFVGFGGTIPGAPVELRSLDGRIEARGHTVSTTGLTLALGPAGTLQLGPASVEVLSVEPPEVGALALRLQGRDLATGAPVAGLRVQDLDLQLSADHALAGPLRIAGDVWIEGATFVPAARKATAASAPLREGAKVAKELFPDILLDVGLHARDGALDVAIPHLPDVSLTLDCRITGSSRRPRVGGRLHGDGLYSRLAIFLYDAFTDTHVRRCGAR